MRVNVREQVGLADLIANDGDDFVKKAQQLSGYKVRIIFVRTCA